ncbi:MAG: hypothetical protein KF703_01035 [Actinobacteria bacterium]|nr:hypothetical protein [Actinomycetota bacterium]
MAARGCTSGRARLLTVALGAAVLVPALAEAAPEPAPPAPPSTGVAGLPAPEPPDPVLDDVEVRTDRTIERAADRLEEARAVKEATTADWLIAEAIRQGATDRSARTATAVATAEGRLAEADRAVDVQARRFADLQAVTDRRQAALADEQAQLRTVAAAVFASAPEDRFQGLGTFEQMSVGNRRAAIRSRLVDEQTAIVDAKAATWRRARAASQAQEQRLRRAERVQRERARSLQRARTAQAEADRAQRAAEEATAERWDALAAADRTRTERRDDWREARLTAQVTGTDMTLVALHAYWRASQLAPCRLPWWVVAGVGHVETRHGTAQGSRVLADGATTVDILGIPLDGRPGTVAIPDSDGGRLDRDATWDRAVGPMQFLPGTWGFFADDANDDGVATPHNLYDAADAAGRLLCRGRGDLTTDAQYRSALLSYNNSLPYASQVLAVGHGYRDELGLPDVPPEDEPATADGG